MSKIKEACKILAALGLPKAQQNERSALILLAMANVGPRGSWQETSQPFHRIWDIRAFIRERYKKDYAPNSRETLRRQTIHQFEQARIVDRNPDDPGRATNSGKNVYKLTDEAAAVLRTFGTDKFDAAVADFIFRFGSLQEAYRKVREGHKIPLTLGDGTIVSFSPGVHNALQVAVIEHFGPRFAPGAVLLYIGDTAHKHSVLNVDQLSCLNMPVTQHSKLPDIILFWPERNWLYLIEAVTSHGPVSPKRHREMEAIMKNCPAGRVYVTAFLDFASFRKHAGDIAWETEVWIANNPDHMIHFNGPKFLGPYTAL